MVVVVVVVIVYLSIYLSVCLSVCLPVCLSVFLPASLNAAILREFLNFWTWQRQNRNNSARIPQFLNLTTSKTKQFCEILSTFEVDNIKNETILRDLLQKWKDQCCAHTFVPIRFAIFLLHLSKVLRLHEKVMPGHTKCCTCHAKSSQQTWRSDAPNATPLRKSAPDLVTWWTCLLYCACHGKCIFTDPLQMSHACHRFWKYNRFWKCYKTLTFCSLLTRCTIPCACHVKRHLNVQNWSETVSF